MKPRVSTLCNADQINQDEAEETWNAGGDDCYRWIKVSYSKYISDLKSQSTRIAFYLTVQSNQNAKLSPQEIKGSSNNIPTPADASHDE